MKKIFFSVWILANILAFLYIMSCADNTTTQQTKIESQNPDLEYQVVVIDSCEYLAGWQRWQTGSFFVTHKGNCKFCKERNK